MGLFDDVFGGGRVSAARDMRHGQEAAMGEYRSAYQDEMGFLNPTMGGRFGGQHLFDAMMDPQGFYNTMMGGYEMSPAAQRELEQGESGVRNAMAAQGMSGSSQAARDAAGYARDFTSNDMQRYFQNQMGILGQGMGLGGTLAGTRDTLGQRLGQGQIGISQANAMEHMGRARGIQNALATGIGAAAGAFGGSPFGMGGASWLNPDTGQTFQYGNQGGFGGALQGLAQYFPYAMG